MANWSIISSYYHRWFQFQSIVVVDFFQTDVVTDESLRWKLEQFNHDIRIKHIVLKFYSYFNLKPKSGEA